MKSLLNGILAASLLLAAISMAFAVTKTPERTGSADEEAVRQTVEKFINAFANLDWEAFRTFFAEDASAFFPPSAHVPQRVDGKANIEAVFKSAFENARKQKSAPPYITIDPKEARIQLLQNVAIVTFHLEDPGIFGRRSIIFHKQNGKWLIVHLHASGIAKPK